MYIRQVDQSLIRIILNWFTIDWNGNLQADNNEATKSLEKILCAFHSLLGRYLGHKKVSSYEL